MTGPCIASLVEEWHRLNQHRSATNEEMDAKCDHQNAIEEELIQTPAETMADVIAKARLLVIVEEERAAPEIAASLLADLERMAGGAS